MSAPDLTALAPPFRTVFIDLGLSDVATEILLPKWVRRFSMRPEVNDAKYSSEGTDGDPIDAEHQTVGAGVLHSFNTDRSGRAGNDTQIVSVFLAATVASTKVRITIESGAT